MKQSLSMNKGNLGVTTTINNMLAIMVSTILVLLIFYCPCEGKDVKFCMPPQATFSEHKTTANYESKQFTHKRIITTSQYDIKSSQQRVDTMENGKIVESEISRLDAYNNTIIFTWNLVDGKCSCINNGPSDSAVFIQCKSLPILEKGSVGGMNGLKIGYNHSDLFPTWTEDDAYWIVPAKSAGYWWFMSHEAYVVDDDNNVEMVSSTYYNQIESCDMDHFYIPKNTCPHESDCPHVRGA